MRADIEAELERFGSTEAFLALARARWLLLDRLTRRMVLVAHGVEAGGWTEVPLRVRVVEAEPSSVHRVSTCDVCGKQVRRVARLGDVWACAEHFPPIQCRSCGDDAKPVAVGRFGIVSADGAAYDREQDVGYRCPSGHLTCGATHMGPGWTGWTRSEGTT
jgi:hypothetical protein